MPSLPRHLVQQIVAVEGEEYMQYCAFVAARSFADALRAARLGRGLVWAPVARGGRASSDFLHYSCGPAHEMYYAPEPRIVPEMNPSQTLLYGAEMPSLTELSTVCTDLRLQICIPKWGYVDDVFVDVLTIFGDDRGWNTETSPIIKSG